MLVELSVVEQRYLAVREALDTGATITDVAHRYGVDRRTVHRWLLRWQLRRERLTLALVAVPLAETASGLAGLWLTLLQRWGSSRPGAPVGASS